MKQPEGQITLVDAEDLVPQTKVEKLLQKAIRQARRTRRKIETGGHGRVVREG